MSKSYNETPGKKLLATDFPSDRFLLEYNHILNLDLGFREYSNIWEKRRNSLNEALKLSAYKRSKKKSNRIHSILKKQKKVFSKRFISLKNKCDSFYESLLKEQAKFILAGFTFSEGVGYDEKIRYFIPKKAETKGVLVCDEKSPIGIKIPVSINKETRTISIGNMDINIPLLRGNKGFDAENAIYKAISKNGFSIPYFSMDNKGIHRSACWLIGSFSKKYLYGLSYHAWISEFEKEIRDFCRTGTILNTKLVMRFMESRLEIEKAISNNERNIIPALMFFNCGISEIKGYVGNENWKKIVHNSASRNNAIFSSMYKFGQFRTPMHINDEKKQDLDNFYFDKNGYLVSLWTNHGVDISFSGYTHNNPNLKNTRSVLDTLINIPTSLLKNASKNELFSIDHYKVDLSTVKWLASVAETQKIMTSKSSLREHADVFLDSRRMAKQLGVVFSEKWSFRKMCKMHNQFIREMALRKKPHKDFIFNRNWPDGVVHDGVMCVLLKSNTDLTVEGIKLRHCVGSYDDLVSSGHSIIYSLTHEKTGIGSTLQLLVNSNKKEMSIRQNRGLYNDPISNKAVEKCINNAAIEILRLANIAKKESPVRKK